MTAVITMIPTPPMTRTRALGSVSGYTSWSVGTHAGATQTCSPTAPESALIVVDVNVADASARGTSLGNSYGFVRVDAAAGMGAIPAAVTDFGRKQGRPPRGTPR